MNTCRRIRFWMQDRQNPDRIYYVRLNEGNLQWFTADGESVGSTVKNYRKFSDIPDEMQRAFIQYYPTKEQRSEQT